MLQPGIAVNFFAQTIRAGMTAVEFAPLALASKIRLVKTERINTVVVPLCRPLYAVPDEARYKLVHTNR